MAAAATTLSTHTHVSELSSVPKEVNRHEAAALSAMSHLTDEVRAVLARTAMKIIIKAENQAEYVDKVMRLEPIVAHLLERSIPSFTLTLTSEEQLTLNQVFQDRALYNEICLLELLAFDLFMHLEELLKYLPSSLAQPKEFVKEKFFKEFSGNFIVGYLSFIAINGTKKERSAGPTMHYVERGMPTPSYCQGLTVREWSLRLEDVKTQLNTLFCHVNKRSRDSTVKKHLKSVCQRLDLLSKLLMHPQASIFLCDFTLCALEKHFPNSAALNNPSPLKTLDDLMHFTRFLSKGFSSGIEMGGLTFFNPLFSELHTHIQVFAQDFHKQKRVAIKSLKNPARKLYTDLHKQHVYFCKSAALAMSGELTHEVYCKANKIKIVLKKSQEDFSAMMHFTSLASNLMCHFSQDWVNILDGRVTAPLFPDTCVPIYRVFDRLNHTSLNFLMDVGDRRELEKSIDLLPLPPFPHPLSEPLTHKIEGMVMEMRKKLSLPIHERLAPVNLSHIMLNWRLLNNSDVRNYTSWLPMLEDLELLLKDFDQFLGQLDAFRAEFLANIVAFLPVQEWILHRQDWIAFFTSALSKECFDLCRIAFIGKDVAACLQFHFDYSDEELLPDALVDLMTLEGIEELVPSIREEPLRIRAALPGPRGMREDIPEDKVKDVAEAATVLTQKGKAPLVKTAEIRLVKPAAPAAPAAPAKPLPAAPSSATQERSTPIKIRRGAKKREILRMLRDLGILPTRVRHAGTSHQKLEGKDQKTAATMPMGSLGSSLPAGTALSIAKQVNRHLGIR